MRITLSHPTDVTVSVDYETRGRLPSHCAAAHTNQSGTLEFSPGDMAKEIVLTIVDDDVACSNDQWRFRRFQVLLTNLQNAAYGNSIGGLADWRRLLHGCSDGRREAAIPGAGIYIYRGVLEGEGPAVVELGLNRTQ